MSVIFIDLLICSAPSLLVHCSVTRDLYASTTLLATASRTDFARNFSVLESSFIW